MILFYYFMQCNAMQCFIAKQVQQLSDGCINKNTWILILNKNMYLFFIYPTPNKCFICLFISDKKYMNR